MKPGVHATAGHADRHASARLATRPGRAAAHRFGALPVRQALRRGLPTRGR